MNKVFLSWDAPEYFPKDRSGDWFWAVGIIAAAIVVTSILLNNVLLAVFFVIATFTIFIYAKRPPDIIKIQITEDGVRAGRNIYPYSMLKGYAVKHEGTTLLLQSSSILNPLIVIPIIGVDPEKIRAVMNSYLGEEEMDIPFLQKILEYLGF